MGSIELLSSSGNRYLIIFIKSLTTIPNTLCRQPRCRAMDSASVLVHNSPCLRLYERQRSSQGLDAVMLCLFSYILILPNRIKYFNLRCAQNIWSDLSFSMTRNFIYNKQFQNSHLTFSFSVNQCGLLSLAGVYLNLKLICGKTEILIIIEGLEIKHEMKSLIKIKHDKITNHYKFLKELGRGASGVCFKVTCKDNDEVIRCVKKIQKKEKNSLPQQAYLLDQLTHPDIIRLYDVFQDENSFYLVVDLCEGGELFDYLSDEGILSEHEAKEIFIQMISAIRYCHEKNIAHRDLKPENFLIFQKTVKGHIPNLKMIDFDLSFQWVNNMVEEMLAKQGKRIIGTPYYIAPEVLKGKYDHRCDIWSAGVILYILVSGVPPFNGNTPNQIFKEIEKQKFSVDIPQMQDVSLLLKDLIKKMLTPADKRITIQQIFKHPWMKITPKKTKMAIDFSAMVRFSKFSRLKQIAATYLAMQMTTKEKSKYEKTFKELDINKDGFLSVQELKAGLSSDSSATKQIQNLLNFVETDESGMMNYSDFIASFVNEKALNERKNLQMVFKMIDNDGNGVVDKQELNAILNRHGLKKKALKQKNINDDLNKIFQVTDKNNDGKIDFEEFVATLLNQIQI